MPHLKTNLLLTVFCIIFSLSLIPATAYALDYYVDQSNGNDANDGLAWGASNALLTINEAITIANGTPEADTVHVAQGTYNEWALTLGSDLTLYGGYPSGGGTRDPATYTTTIDGNSTATVIFCDTISNVIIDGFTITNGQGNGGFDQHHGGGFYIRSCTNLTISNYIGIAIAIVVGLAVAGLDFSRLALIAGALSVGIGFGLQNIVNNFVAGLILLFERPIKTGDWIVANNVEGRVKRISIRSTEIESFDRADIIVPNSLLISDNLTNWVHKTHYGRLRIPVSVAYGSDTELVKQLLIDIALGYPGVIVGNPQMHDPKVLFLAFGESSLDFELRFFVHNIENRLDITSDFNFAIDKAFREHDIEIPFPQRDIHIRESTPDVTSDPGDRND